MTTISVIMSTYNDSEYLAESIDSVLTQTFADFKFIIVNDGSPDPRTVGILSEYEKRDNRIKVMHKNNEGLTKALIEGCKTAVGRYIARIDVGDIMISTRLDKQKKILDENQDCAFVSCETEFCGPKWEHLWVKRAMHAYNKPVVIIPDDPVGPEWIIPHHCSVMFRHTAYGSVGGYRKQFYYAQDWDLWHRLTRAGKFYLIPEVLYRVRIFPNSISMFNKRCQDVLFKYLKGAFAAVQNNKDEQPWLEKASLIRPDVSKLEKRKNTEPGFYFIGEALRRNGDNRCRHYFCKAMRQAPWCARSYIRWILSFLKTMEGRK